MLDVLLDRQPHAEFAARLMTYADRNVLEGMLCATTVTTMYYLLSKAAGAAQAARHVESILAIFDVAPVDGTVLLSAMTLSFSDYEDAVLHESARLAGAEGIVTRNQRDFGNSSIRVYAPSEILGVIQASL